MIYKNNEQQKCILLDHVDRAYKLIELIGLCEANRQYPVNTQR